MSKQRNTKQVADNDTHVQRCLLSRRYEVTPDGVLINLNWRGTGRAAPVSTWQSNSGYLNCWLQDAEGVRKMVCVHRVVAIARHGMPLYTDMQVDHIDGIKTNFHPSNLQWVSASENALRAFHIGLRVPPPHTCAGEANARSKLSTATVIAIRRRCEKGETYAAVARAFGIGSRLVRKVATGSRWAHLPNAVIQDRSKGERHPNSKLSEADVRSIFLRLKDGKTQAAIARELRVSMASVCLIASGKHWKHIHAEVMHG